MRSHIMHHFSDMGGEVFPGICRSLRDASHAAVLRSPRVRAIGISLRLGGFKLRAIVCQQLGHFRVNFLNHEGRMPCSK